MRIPKLEQRLFVLAIVVLIGVVGNNVYRRQNRAALVHAILTNDSVSAVRLLKSGITPSQTYAEKTPPFAGARRSLVYGAVERNNPELVQALLSYGAKADEEALSLAVVERKPSLVKALLAAGANPNSQPKDVANLYQPLTLMAVENNDVETLSALLEKGANVEGHNAMSGMTPLILGVERNYPEIVETVFKYGANMNVRDNYQGTAMSAALRHENLAMVKRLVSQGVDVNQRGVEGYTPLMVAAAQGNTEIVRYLLSKQAKRDLTAFNGDTAIRLAAQHPEIIALLNQPRNAPESFP